MSAKLSGKEMRTSALSSCGASFVKGFTRMKLSMKKPSRHQKILATILSKPPEVAGAGWSYFLLIATVVGVVAIVGLFFGK